mgnify:CR=1 FL=1
MRNLLSVVVRAAGVALATLLFAQMPAAHALGEYPVASPGAFLVSTVLANNGQPYQCTAGFTVRTPSGAPGMLTAGHCRRDPVNDTVLQRTPTGDQFIGRYVRWEVIPGVHDMGLVDLAAFAVLAAAQFGQAGDQAARVGVGRRGQHLFAAALLDHAAGVHHRHAVAGLGDHAHVVRDQHHRRAALAAQFF